MLTYILLLCCLVLGAGGCTSGSSNKKKHEDPVLKVAMKMINDHYLQQGDKSKRKLLKIVSSDQKVVSRLEHTFDVIIANGQENASCQVSIKPSSLGNTLQKTADVKCTPIDSEDAVDPDDPDSDLVLDIVLGHDVDLDIVLDLDLDHDHNHDHDHDHDHDLDLDPDPAYYIDYLVESPKKDILYHDEKNILYHDEKDILYHDPSVRHFTDQTVTMNSKDAQDAFFCALALIKSQLSEFNEYRTSKIMRIKHGSNYLYIFTDVVLSTCKGQRKERCRRKETVCSFKAAMKSGSESTCYVYSVKCKPPKDYSSVGRNAPRQIFRNNRH
ncbi:uncharacterized protein LOC131953403 [Physella acuta]|uniref:uncharacterized protein LOC131953403 n=1 Tax=Physella acuta TaxID=109671 RepID=UPI0027DE9DFE|nr:uncharacterized protein LOC131953403 [Physella acuta]